MYRSFCAWDNVNLVGRTMDFPINIGTNIVGFNKGVHQVSTYMDKKGSPAKIAE